MPAALTYPGVYIEEIPSGVRTVMGVSTSVTAFVGAAKRGPINKPVRIFSFSDYERRFGGLWTESEMSYAVKQFFLNGGTDAWIVRVAKDAKAARLILNDPSSSATLELEALEEGSAGNYIEVAVDYGTTNPASTFNLRLSFSSPDNPEGRISEDYLNCSMNSKDSNFVETLVNDVSQLVKVKSLRSVAVGDKGRSVSGQLTTTGDTPTDLELKALIDNKHNSLRISVNGEQPQEVVLSQSDFANPSAGQSPLAKLCATINTKISGASFSENSDHKIEIQSAVGGENSIIRVLYGLENDVSARLKLGTINGGVETDASASIRPVEVPAQSILTTGTITFVANTLPSASNSSFRLTLDGYGPVTVNLGKDPVANLSAMADLIQKKVRELMEGTLAYEEFICRIKTGTNQLELISGSQGKGSLVKVEKAEDYDIAAVNFLNMLGIGTEPTNCPLTGGVEYSFGANDIYSVYSGNGVPRKGIYALEEVDLFNIMCLPGVEEKGTLAEAESYCRKRRAFLIIDSPQKSTTPAKMAEKIAKPDLPKSNYSAVFYPWLKVPDPLMNGKLQSRPPSGTIAGLFARTDSNRGVWKAPAGTDANLIGVQGLDYVLTDPENGSLNPLGVNCIRAFPVYGIVSWGARTLRGADQMADEYKYIPVRRLALFIEESLYRALKWVVFEPNDEPLWSQIRLNVGAFMHDLFRQGAFQGSTPKDAYFVKCDRETTTQNDINRGVVNIVVGFAPLKPAEFVVIKLQQMAGQIQT